MKYLQANWLDEASIEASKPISLGDRIFGVFILLLSVVILHILTLHLLQETGFIIRELHSLELVLLFGYWVAWIITATLDSVLGMRLASRLFDSFGGILFMAISSLYFFWVFPFEFSLFTSVLPESIQFLLGWLTNSVARGLLLVGGIGMLFASVYSPIVYKIWNIKVYSN
jgi:hypothetical protein